jgi:hypothetical protein
MIISVHLLSALTALISFICYKTTSFSNPLLCYVTLYYITLYYVQLLCNKIFYNLK